MLSLKQKKDVYAQGVFHFGEHAVPVQLVANYGVHSAEDVIVKAWSDDERVHRIFSLSMDFPGFARFEGKTDWGDDVWIIGIQPTTIRGFNHIEGNAGVFIQGDLRETIKPNERVSVYAKTSSTPVISPEWSYRLSSDGTITTISDGKDRTGISWQNDLGEMRLIDTYEYINGQDDNENETLRIRTNSLIVSITPTVETELKAFLLDFPKSLYEDLTLLSFIGRKRIVCFEASISKNEGERSISGFARYRNWGGFYNLPSDQSFLRSIIRPQDLRKGVFSDLIEKYRQSPHKEVIDRTLPYLLASYEDGYVETHLVNAYAALESMVDGIGSALGIENLLGSNPFKRLSRKIEDLIRTEISEDAIAEGVIKKIPELRRQSYIDRLLYLINTQGINTKLIWPPETNEPEQLHEIIKRRNLLIHSGVIDKGDLCVFDLNRVQKLVELWILKLLECPEEAINEYSLWRGAPINQILHY